MNKEKMQKAAKKAPTAPKVIRHPSKPMNIVVKAPSELADADMIWKIANAEVCLFWGK